MTNTTEEGTIKFGDIVLTKSQYLASKKSFEKEEAAYWYSKALGDVVNKILLKSNEPDTILINNVYSLMEEGLKHTWLE